MSEYIIGRDAATSQLDVIIDGKTIRLGQPQSVPRTVSRQHCSITIDGDRMVIKNLKAENTTAVNGHDVEQKSIKAGDVVTLGAQAYPLPLAEVIAAIRKSMPTVVDIRPLRQVWEQYHDEEMKLKIKQGRFVAITSGTGLITMGAVVLSFLGGPLGVRIACYVVAAVFILITVVLRWKDASAVPLQQEKMRKWLTQNYACPNCHHSFNIGYDQLSQYDSCPYCKAKFKK